MEGQDAAGEVRLAQVRHRAPAVGRGDADVVLVGAARVFDVDGAGRQQMPAEGVGDVEQPLTAFVQALEACEQFLLAFVLRFPAPTVVMVTDGLCSPPHTSTFSPGHVELASGAVPASLHLSLQPSSFTAF